MLVAVVAPWLRKCALSTRLYRIIGNHGETDYFIRILPVASSKIETTEYSKIQLLSDPFTMFSKFSWFTLIILGTCLFAKVQPEYSDIVCPGGQTECPVNMSCCSLPDGTFGCCPFLNAVCCVDHLHCCPAGKKITQYIY